MASLTITDCTIFGIYVGKFTCEKPEGTDFVFVDLSTALNNNNEAIPVLRLTFVGADGEVLGMRPII